MSERYLELHSEFRDRYILFHMADGTTLDSRLINWRRVDWPCVVKLDARLRGRTTVVDCNHLGFKFFLNFKVNRIEGPTSFVHWVIGWTDGEIAHLTAINFKTGKVAATYTQPLSHMEGHIHPRCQGTVAGDKPGAHTETMLGY